MSVKGDARSEPSSSAAGRWARVLAGCERFAGPMFAGFVLLHCAAEAFRAHQSGALPSAGFELAPGVVAPLSLLVLGPFAVLAWRELQGEIAAPHAATGRGSQARALALLERVTLVLVLAFSVGHMAQIAWPLLDGTFAASDVRPELSARLSSTWHGVPLLAAAYICGVGAAAFLGARFGLRTPSEPRRRSHARAIAALGIAAYVLGSYAVIRLASGAIFR